MTTIITATTIDEVLGEASSRFFGAIYRTAQQDMSVQFTPRWDGSWDISGKASVHYVTSWGERRGKQRIPHLSTIDAVLMLAQLGRKFYDEAFQAGFCSELEIINIMHVMVRAGSVPDEDLNNMPVSGELTIEDRAIQARVQIGNMYTIADYRVEAGKNQLDSAAIIAEATPKIGLTDVVIDPAAGRATATVEIAEPINFLPGESLLVANIIACSQIGQALMAMLDEIPREKSNTLWMRKYEGWVSENSGEDSLLKAVVVSDEHLLLPVKEEKLSIYNGHGSGCNVDCEYSIAHALPHQ